MENKKNNVSFNEIRDRFIEDDKRRMNGAFYTPRIWVEEGYKYLADKLGENWQNEYVIWDCCCGSGNLTRGLKYTTRFLSTLEEDEVDAAISGFNISYPIFQYDFLNDDIETEHSLGTWNDGVRISEYRALRTKEVDEAVLQYKDTKLFQQQSGDCLIRLLLTGQYSQDEKYRSNLKNKKSLLFLINPPYAAAGNLKDVSNTKTGVNKTLVRDDIVNNSGIRGISENLYAQFFYRILCMIRQFRNCNIMVASYVKSTFWTGSKYKPLRDAFEKEGYFIDCGFNFKGSEFEGCSDKWSLTFSLLRKKDELDSGSMNECNLQIKERQFDTLKNTYVIKNICDSELFYCPSDKDMLSNYVREKCYMKKYDAPQMSNALSLTTGNSFRGVFEEEALGYLAFVSNCVDKHKFVYGLSSCASMGNGFNIFSSNYDRALTGFVARKLIKPNWINQKKEFLRPNENSTLYREFELDSYIAALFIDGATWSSLRNFYYKSLISEDNLIKSKNKKSLIPIGKKIGSVERIESNRYNIYNEFFWLSKSFVNGLSEKREQITYSVYEDCQNDIRDESFTYQNKIFPNLDKFSIEAKTVLDLATELVELSFKYRNKAIQNNPEWYLNAWDAGWYQIKKLIKSDYCKDDEVLQNKYKEFEIALKNLENKMRPMVYELGFLK